jgi:hypothetical protein
MSTTDITDNILSGSRARLIPVVADSMAKRALTLRDPKSVNLN